MCTCKKITGVIINIFDNVVRRFLLKAVCVNNSLILSHIVKFQFLEPSIFEPPDN